MVIVWAQLDLTLREGSRSRNRFSGIAGGSNATIVGEGPIGRTERGAWLIALRQSFLEWPTEAEQSSRTAFGFSDGIAKLVDDLRPDHQLSLGVLAGRAAIDGDDNPVPEAPGAGTSATSVVNLAWRAALGPRLVINQRAYIVDHSFVNKHQTGEDRDRGASEEIVYRADVLRPVAGGLLEAGARAGRTAIHDAPGSSHAGSIAGSSWLRSGYAHFSWAVTPRITLSPGVRISQSTLLPHPAVTRWLLSEWTFPRRWTLTASAGISRQSPELRHVLPGGGLDLRPERATHVDVGLTRRESESLRWQATVFTREEADILREPDVYPRLVDDVIVPPDSGRYVNALGGSSRGAELLVERATPRACQAGRCIRSADRVKGIRNGARRSGAISISGTR